jgi:uncharacterized protein (DUF983 family)
LIQVRSARQALARAIRLRCPRCGLARLFRGPFAMLERCPVCRLRVEREQGYFVGAIYLNYGATIVTVMVGYFGLHYFARPSLWQQLLLWGGFSILFPLWFFRYSKSLWLSLDYFLDPEDAQEEGE